MARSGSKQGNRRHRVKVRVYDKETDTLRVVKDASGRPLIIGIPTPVSDSRIEYWAREKEMWAREREQRETVARIEAEAEAMKEGVLST